MQDDWRRWLRQRLRRLRRPAFLGALRRTRPLSDKWGFDRGRPVDRYYIESFMAAHRTDIRGRVLEVQAPLYIERFGTSVERTDIVDVVADNPLATIVADLQSPSAIESDSFDCFVLTQTLQLYDYRAAIRHAHRILRPSVLRRISCPLVYGPILSRFGASGNLGAVHSVLSRRGRSVQLPCDIIPEFVRGRCERE